MRPDPPAPDTPNEGRTRKYRPLVPQEQAIEAHHRGWQAALVGAGLALGLLANAVVSLLT